MRISIRKRRGMAMLLAMSAVGIAAILGLALVSSAMLQNHTGRNATASVAADALAESGIDLACMYLVCPEKAPAFSGDYWPGQTGLSFGASVPGAVDVSVARTAKNNYTITALATLGGAQRTATATVKVNPGFRVKYGLASEPAITVPSNSVIDSDVQINGSLTNKGWIKRNVRSTSLVNLGWLDGVWSLLDLTSDPMNIPSVANVNHYSTYTYNGSVYSAKEITVGTLSAGTTLGPTADNPAGIFHVTGALRISANVTINGSLIADSGASIYLAGANITVNPAAGYPAAVVNGVLDLRHSKYFTASATFNGILWTSGTVKSTLETIGLYSSGSLNVSGAWLCAGGSVDSGFRGKINVTHVPAKVAGVNLDTSILPPGVFIQSFK